ncbi:OmpA family protein [Fodinicurvata sediminis]|uniref:OmpA family protein n=1 Tax=Fodinicurvata sediminis TaxID=1121832 RepID=UPI0004190BC2|nr:OmpA family protein [Fodinicurvata sediminis]
MRRSKNVSFTRQFAGRRAMALSKSGLLGATALLLLAGAPQAVVAQGNSSNSAITVNRDVIESLDSPGHRQERSFDTQQQTTPWGTPLPGSPYARLPNRSMGTGQTATGDGGLAFPPQEMPRSTLLIGDDRPTTAASPTTASKTPTTEDHRSTSPSTTTASSSRSPMQEATRQEAPAKPARGKPRSVLPPDETEATEPLDSASELREDERTTPVPETTDDDAGDQDVSTQLAEDTPDTTAEDQTDTPEQPENMAAPQSQQNDTAADEGEAESEASPAQQGSQQDVPSTDMDTDENGSESQIASSQDEPSPSNQDSTDESPSETQATSNSQADTEQQEPQQDSDVRSDGSQADETQQASLPDAADTGEVSEKTIEFTSESADLSENARSQLRQLAAQLSERSSMRVQLLAYAEGSNEDASQARRLSLSRALAVRAYLLDHGIRSTRIDVRALGHNAPGSGPVNRVDIVPEDSEES